MNLAGLGYIAGGVSQGLDAGTKRALEQLQIQAQQQSLSGQKDAGTALMSMNGVQPQQQPQGGLGALGALLGGGKPPQQPGAPMQLQGAMPQQAPPQMAQAQPMQPPGAQPQGGGVPPQLQAAAQHLDFSTLTNTLAKAPGMTPERLMAALSALSPYMNMQSQLDFKKIQEQALLQNAGSRRESADAAMKNADTNAATKPIIAGATKEKADASVQNTEDLIKNRDAKAGVDQEKLAQGKRHLDLIEKAGAAKDRASVELNYRGLQTARANALLAAHGDENDATVKGIDEQLKLANQTLQRMRDAPSQHPQGWDGKDQGRTEPLVATPMPEKGGAAPKGMPEGARKAPDGKYYVPDPNRAGKYLRVEE